jgi:CBS domain-containing protein
MKLVKYIIESKGNDIWQIASDDSVLNAIKMMADKRVGALLVIDDKRLSGIVSERDYARKVILQGRSSETTPVKDIMTADVISAIPTNTVEECMEMMSENRIRHLPVIDGGEIVGVLSIGDLVKAIIDEQQFTIRQLKHYIAS